MDTVKILQWNVWYHERCENIVNFIKHINPDIVCCQELTVNFKEANPGINVPKEIAQACGYNYFFHPMTIYGNGNEAVQMGNGVFSKFPIISSDFKYIQRSDPNIKSYETEDRTYIESVLDIGGKYLRVGTVHLSYSTAFAMTEKRLNEAEKLYAAVQNNHEKFILTGDMNAKPDSPIIKKIEEMFIHADPNTDRATWTTKPFSYQGFKADSRDWRLDYIFATEDINILSNKIIDTTYSDHLPVLSEIQF
jgi:endonuclease/exonuclease/phosphatase family metal-dependent hydrolase